MREARLRHRLGDYAGGLAVARAVIGRFPDRAWLRHFEIDALAGLGRENEAGAGVDALARTPPTPETSPADVLEELARDFRYHGRPALAAPRELVGGLGRGLDVRPGADRRGGAPM